RVTLEMIDEVHYAALKGYIKVVYLIMNHLINTDIRYMSAAKKNIHKNPTGGDGWKQHLRGEHNYVDQLAHEGMKVCIGDV
ncbi:hypothetical protein ACJX0J_018400, partial [Zea mays]